MFIRSIKIINIATIIAIFSLCEAKIHSQTTIYEGSHNPYADEVDLSPFTKIGHKYYLIVETKSNWYGAQNDCAQRGGKGASIESEEEMNALNTYLESRSFSSDTSFWLSGTDLEHEGEFKWMSTGQKFSYTRWSPGQPDNYNGNQHCVHLWHQNGRYEWDDDTCSNYSYYICETDSPRSILINFW